MKREPRNMKKFLVTYLAPASVIAEWKKTDPDTRKAAEEKMRAEWKKWMNDHANIFADIGAGVGKTKVVTAQGISDSKNDIMLYSLVEAGHMKRQPNRSRAIRICRFRSLPSKLWKFMPCPG